jgi:prepilin-type N-terminal cleavage/methylation domain-containing protein
VTPSPQRATGAGGFTLLELLVVIGLMSLLMGIGVGFLQRGSTDLDVALSIVRDQMRLAANTARARALPTEVRVIPGEDGQPTQLQALVLANVGFWHFEPEEIWVRAMLKPVLTGKPEPHGRFGQAWRPDPDARSPMMTVNAGQAGVDLADGFAFRIELWLDERAPMNIARLGQAFELDLDGDGVPVAKSTPAAPGGRAGPVATLIGSRGLPVHTWVTLELVHDGRSLVVLVDGREEGRTRASAPLLQKADDLLEVSLAGAPVRGVVDEVQLLAYERAVPVDVPADVELRDLQGPVRFSRRGELLTPTRFTAVAGEESAARYVAPGGVLRPWVDGAKP